MNEEDIWVGDWVLFSQDLAAGTSTWYNPKEDVMKTTSDVTHIINSNKIDRAEQSATWGNGQRVASIPLNVYHDQLAAAVEQDDRKYLSRFLNDSENAAWRTREGTV